MRVLVAGATGTIGRAVVVELVAQGHDVVCALRPGSVVPQAGSVVVECQLTEPGNLTRALDGERLDAVISCMATRNGAPADAWAVEHDAQVNLLAEAKAAGARQFILLSAICVQKPVLAFQQAKLAFERKLEASGIEWTIVRPTAYFKSLSGQVARVMSGKPFLVFGDGLLTACKPISDSDLARYLVLCLSRDDARNAILPIGGPGPAITPLQQAALLFGALGETPRIRHVPVGMMDAVVGGLAFLARFSQRMADKAEFARTGRYYATESMLVWNAATGRYDAEATPEFGSESLAGHYARMIAGDASSDLGAHAAFGRAW
jgi:divinyl chlorophyllide a 8-vinyl-reductase